MEGKRRKRDVPVTAIVDEVIGMAAYMEIGPLNKLTGEGDVASATVLFVEPSALTRLLMRLKELPVIESVAMKAYTLRSFLEKIGDLVLVMSGILTTFAVIIAIGIVYNSARIGLHERARELASLRVLGFHTRRSRAHFFQRVHDRNCRSHPDRNCPFARDYRPDLELASERKLSDSRRDRRPHIRGGVRDRDRGCGGQRLCRAPAHRQSRSRCGSQGEGLTMKLTRGRVISVTAFVAVLALAAWAMLPKPIPVDTAIVTKGKFVATVDEDGKTRVRERYVVAAPLAGRLQRVRLKAGDAVKADEVVTTILPAPAPFLDPRSRREAEERLGTAEAARERTKAMVERARAQTVQQQSDLDRARALKQSGATTAQALERAETAMRLADRELRAAEFQDHATEHEVEQAKAILAQYQDATAEKPPERWSVTAPMSGRRPQRHAGKRDCRAGGRADHGNR